MRSCNWGRLPEHRVLGSLGKVMYRAGALEAQEHGGRDAQERHVGGGAGGRQGSGEGMGGRGTPASPEQLKLAGLKLISYDFTQHHVWQTWPGASQVSGAPRGFLKPCKYLAWDGGGGTADQPWARQWAGGSPVFRIQHAVQGEGRSGPRLLQYTVSAGPTASGARGTSTYTQWRSQDQTLHKVGEELRRKGSLLS
jgi:hypothetical protein